MVYDTRLYDILQISPDATLETIKKKFKLLALKYHPDKNTSGDDTKFKEINEAYNILSDEKSRSIYDKCGKISSLQQQQRQEQDLDFMNSIFRNFNFSNKYHKRTADINYNLYLDLKQIFTGVSKKIRISRNILCNTCDGNGGSNVKQCDKCNGTGIITRINNIGNFIQQIQCVCSTCTGTGQTYSRVCNQCNGQKVIAKSEELQIKVEPGTPTGHIIIFQNKANEEKNAETGNFIVTVISNPLNDDNIRKHGNYHRINRNDLQIDITIDLITALIGGELSWLHLDEENVSLSLPKGKVISHGDIITLNEYGLLGENKKYGCLYVKFLIKMPSNIWSREVDETLVRKMLNTKS